jgi:hypothetical protein
MSPAPFLLIAVVLFTGPVNAQERVRYLFPGEWLVARTPFKWRDTRAIVAIDRASVTKVGDRAQITGISIDEWNVGGIRTNLYKLDIDCRTKSMRETIINYDPEGVQVGAPSVGKEDEVPPASSFHRAAIDYACFGKPGIFDTLAVQDVQAEALALFKRK